MTLQKFTDELIAITGSKIGELLLFKMGAALGQISFRISKDQPSSQEGPENSARALDERLIFRGWGRCLGINTESEANATAYVVKVKGSPLSYKRVAAEPTCHVMRGIIAGWLETQLGRKADASTETECMSMGDPHCTFRIRFKPR